MRPPEGRHGIIESTDLRCPDCGMGFLEYPAALVTKARRLYVECPGCMTLIQVRLVEQDGLPTEIRQLTKAELEGRRSQSDTDGGAV